MKRFLKVLSLIIVLVVMLTIFVLPVAAQSGNPEEPAAGVEFSDLLVQWGSLAGFAGLIALLINVLKSVGWVKDGQATTVSSGLNLLLLAGLLAARVFKPELDIAGIDSQVASFVQVGLVVFGYVLQLLSSKLTHSAVAGIPLIGKSFSLDMAKMTYQPPVG